LSPLHREGNMERKRLLELAVETLEKQRAEVTAEIESIRAELNGAGPGVGRTVRPIAAIIRKRRSKTFAERKALSRKLKRIWAARKLQAAQAAARAKGRSKTAAEKKALSLKMKAVWAKKRMEAGLIKAATKSKAVKAPKKT